MLSRAVEMFAFRLSLLRFANTLDRIWAFFPRRSTHLRRHNGWSAAALSVLVGRLKRSAKESVAFFPASRDSIMLGSTYSFFVAFFFAQGKKDHSVSCVPAGYPGGRPII